MVMKTAKFNGNGEINRLPTENIHHSLTEQLPLLPVEIYKKNFFIFF